MASSTGLTAPSSPVGTNTTPPPATTMEPNMDAGLLALACSGSFHDLESFLDGKPAAFTMGSSATQPPDLYAVTVGGNTLLHVVAASHGDSEDLLDKARLVYSKAHSLLFVQNNEGDTPLHCAARAWNIPMMSLLIDLANGQGINNAKGLLETQNKLKETALHEAVRFGSNDMVNLLMARDPELATLPEEGTSPLYLAILLENGIIAKTLYELSGGVLSYSGPNGRNALHVAVQRSQDLTKMLLEWNNDLIQQGDANGIMPLQFAVVDILRRRKRASQPICFELLKVNPDALYQSDRNGSFPTHVAASVGATSIITDFLMKSHNCAGLLDARGRTFLHVAVDKMKIGIVDYACRNISLSWILNIQDKDGNTALHIAESDAQILGVLNYIGAKRGISHQGFLNEYDTDQARQDEIHLLRQMKEGTQSRCICSVLIATVTFGAMFTMPGGYRDEDHTHAGSPILAGTFGFDIFFMANTLAFAFSTTATIFLMFSGDPTVPLGIRKVLFRRSISIILISVSCMTLAFTIAAVMMLVPVALMSAFAVVLSVDLVVVYVCWEAVFKSIFLFAALCRRNGIWYGIVWACPFAAVFFMSSISVACSFALGSHAGGKVEPPAQPPAPFA
ncbi:ankyrin repeat-containing protein At5g02620 isoform X2 [Triticum aestivum]|uniref:ankyrin repeat-containing protein At5g02620 isoform X2 n=1 Tax=Triticum aestivum TaxID=4565 RepID=UPI001D02C3C3|nr:ankyrin repeat-containing protein At5g02620-like isoform X2 [Triticum aestivum]